MTQAPRIHLKGHIDVPQDRLAEVTLALPDHIAKTHAEPGCISFNVTPDSTVAGRFSVEEVFIDRAAFDAHQTRTAASPWAKVTQGIPRDYAISEIQG